MNPLTRIAVTLALVALTTSGFSQDSTPDPDGVTTSRDGARHLPLPKEEGVWHFVVFGDRTGGPPQGVAVLRQAVADTNLLDPDLVMTVGDLVEGYNTTERWLEQMREFHDAMNGLQRPWYPVAGNHDIYWRPQKTAPPGHHETSYEKHFGPLWYSFRHKGSAFVVLYSDEGDPDTNTKSLNRPEHTQMSAEQINWLRKTLQETRDAEHVFVFLHHPRWITRRYPGSNWDDVHDVLRQAGNVTAVFAGHIHRMHYGGIRDGIEYITLATTGGHKNHEIPQAGWLHHFNVVTVRPDSMSVAAVPVGAVVDPRKMTPDRLEDIDRLLSSFRPTPSLPVEIRADGSVHGSYLCEMTNPSSKSVSLTASVNAPGWYVRPDHIHLEFEAGEPLELRFECRRPAAELDGEYRLPQILLTTEYLGEARITLPERMHTFGATFGHLTPDFFTTGTGALQLKGSGACVRVPSGKASIPDGPFTLEGWIRAETFQGRRPFLTKTESSEYGIFVSGGTGELSVHLNGRYASVKAAGPKLEPRRWHHIAGVFDGAEIRLYVDGRIRGARGAVGVRTRNEHPLYVGADPNGSGNPVNSLRGWIDEVRLSTVARYDADFTPAGRLEPDEHTALLLHLDKGVGPLTPDHSPAEAHGTLVGSAACAERP